MYFNVSRPQLLVMPYVVLRWGCGWHHDLLGHQIHAKGCNGDAKPGK